MLPEGTEPSKQWEVALSAVRWLRAQLDGAGRKGQQLLVLGNGEILGTLLGLVIREPRVHRS